LENPHIAYGYAPVFPNPRASIKTKSGF